MRVPCQRLVAPTLYDESAERGGAGRSSDSVGDVNMVTVVEDKKRSRALWLGFLTFGRDGGGCSVLDERDAGALFALAEGAQPFV